jgi:hypothetical protein
VNLEWIGGKVPLAARRSLSSSLVLQPQKRAPHPLRIRSWQVKLLVFGMLHECAHHTWGSNETKMVHR